MRRELATLKADVEDEMAKIGRLAENFASIEPRLDDPPEKVPFYDRAAIGYYLHGFYNGSENILAIPARVPGRLGTAVPGEPHTLTRWSGARTGGLRLAGTWRWPRHSGAGATTSGPASPPSRRPRRR
jgi:hypothetical protein